MGYITGFRLRAGSKKGSTTAVGSVSLPLPHEDAAARDRVIEKIRTMGESFFQMPEREYGEWLNALPRAEFIELIALSCEDKKVALTERG